MSWLRLVPLFMVTIYLIIFISPVRLHILIKHGAKEKDVVLGVRLLWGLIRYNIDIPKLVYKDKKVELEAEFEKAKKKPFFDIHKKVGLKKEVLALVLNERKNFKKISSNIMKYSKKWVRVLELEWKTTYGTTDAADTGLLYGVLWQVKITMVGVVGKVAKLGKPAISIVPKFNKTVFSTKLNCIITFPLGYIITVGIYLLFFLIKTKIKYLRGVNFVRSSNSRVNENRYGKH
ncbi:DUF2953 domain-containing protein [Proteinivorax hydrogeniformans]|uniref:DUF2953 domain-containing protein n=1 Tax=Proteinivorax hydrogeniformans TaxID=1826727 RepID=A0AAU8HQA6_9FIRM